MLDNVTPLKGEALLSCKLLEAQGYSNQNYLLKTDKQAYILRKLLRDDVDRDQEWELQNLAFKKGLSAEPIWFDRLQGFMLFSYLDGIHKEHIEKKEIIQLISALHKLHAITSDKLPITLDIQDRSMKVENAFKIIEEYPHEYCVCHNDLNTKNIFFTNEVKFIDFEYAGVNDRYFDLVCISVEFQLDKTLEKFMLDTYFETSYHMEKFEAYKVIYRALCSEWFDNMI